MRDGRRGFCIRMEIPDDEKVRELHETVRDYWGQDHVVFVKEYMLLDPEAQISQVVSDGDVVETIPDLMSLESMEAFFVSE